jgi:hypothetical protein
MLGETKRMAEQAHNRTSDDHISQVLDSRTQYWVTFQFELLTTHLPVLLDDPANVLT